MLYQVHLALAGFELTTLTLTIIWRQEPPMQIILYQYLVTCRQNPKVLELMGWGGGRGTIVSYKIEKENIILSTMCACLLKGWDMFMYRRKNSYIILKIWLFLKNK
jgi:hypothetical protein